MIKIKESTKAKHKLSAIRYGWLGRALSRKDALGRTGMEIFNEYDIEIVHGSDKADFGFSMHGDPVKGVRKKDCILFKGEPPIYNIFYGWKLNEPSYLRKFRAVMSNSVLEDVNYIPVFSPQPFYDGDKCYSDVYFDVPKEQLLCMVLRSKKWANRLNALHYDLRKFNRNSSLELRRDMDKEFCSVLGKGCYSSFGLKSKWASPCFHGPIKTHDQKNINYNNRYTEISKYMFNFCPENSRFNGYLTEKPLQAITCGSIPIYIGAPDVADILPEYTYIDGSQFTVKELASLMLNMGEKEHERYRDRMKKFITSKEADPFSSYTFAKKIAEVLGC